MNACYADTHKGDSELEFPSPTGVNYYELKQLGFNGGVFTINGFPSPTGVNYYESLPTKP